MINAALPLYVSKRREDGGEPNSISILPVLCAGDCHAPGQMLHCVSDP